MTQNRVVENPTDLDRTKHDTDFIPIQWLDGNILSTWRFFFLVFLDCFAKVLNTIKSGFNLCEGIVFPISVVRDQI